MREILNRSFEILDAAIEQYKPSHVVGMFSGGDDSTTSMRVLEMWSALRGIPFKAAHINTGIGIEETRQHVRKVSADRGWDFSEFKTPPDEYRKMVLGLKRGVAGGFPGPAMHSIYYRCLKERRVADLIRGLKTKRIENIMLVTGARRGESKRRMSTTQEVRKVKSAVWVNPILYWTKVECLNFLKAERMPRNMVSQILHMSGECLCGAMNEPGELAMIRAFYPPAGAEIDALTKEVEAAGYPWAWDEEMPKWFRAWHKGQDFLDGFMPMCTGCISRFEGAKP